MAMCNWLTVNEQEKILTCGSNYGVPRSVTRQAIAAYFDRDEEKFDDLLSEWADNEAIDAIAEKIMEYTEGD